MPRPSSNSLARILPRQLQFHSMHSATNLLFHRPRSGLTFPSCHSRGKTNRWERPHLQKNCAFYFYLRLVPFIPRSCRHLSMYGRAVFLELIIVLILPLLRSRRPKPLIFYLFFLVEKTAEGTGRRPPGRFVLLAAARSFALPYWFPTPHFVPRRNLSSGYAPFSAPLPIPVRSHCRGALSVGR